MYTTQGLREASRFSLSVSTHKHTPSLIRSLSHTTLISTCVQTPLSCPLQAARFPLVKSLCVVSQSLGQDDGSSIGRSVFLSLQSGYLLWVCFIPLSTLYCPLPLGYTYTHIHAHIHTGLPGKFSLSGYLLWVCSVPQAHTHTHKDTQSVLLSYQSVPQLIGTVDHLFSAVKRETHFSYILFKLQCSYSTLRGIKYCVPLFASFLSPSLSRSPFPPSCPHLLTFSPLSSPCVGTPSVELGKYSPPVSYLTPSLSSCAHTCSMMNYSTHNALFYLSEEVPATNIIVFHLLTNTTPFLQAHHLSSTLDLQLFCLH